MQLRLLAGDVVGFAPRDYPLPRVDPPVRAISSIRCKLTLATRLPGGVTRYTLDGSDPAPTSPEYKSPVPIARTTTVKARTYWEKGKYGQPAASDLFIGDFTRDYPGPQYETGRHAVSRRAESRPRQARQDGRPRIYSR